MTVIKEELLTFTFPAHWIAEKYDAWSFYKNQFQNVCGGSKAVDIVAVDPKQCVWLIEAKDYRTHNRTKSMHIADEVAQKVRDSLAGLFAAAANANDLTEKAAASSIMQASRMRVVLHLEQPFTRSKLHPKPIVRVNVIQKLKQILKAVDPHPLVVDKKNLRGCGWNVT